MGAVCLYVNLSTRSVTQIALQIYLELGSFIYVSGDNSFSKVTGYKVGDRGSIPSRVPVLHQVLTHIWLVYISRNNLLVNMITFQN
jgi:hypothetical protein